MYKDGLTGVEWQVNAPTTSKDDPLLSLHRMIMVSRRMGIMGLHTCFKKDS